MPRSSVFLTLEWRKSDGPQEETPKGHEELNDAEEMGKRSRRRSKKRTNSREGSRELLATDGADKTKKAVKPKKTHSNEEDDKLKRNISPTSTVSTTTDDLVRSEQPPSVDQNTTTLKSQLKLSVERLAAVDEIIAREDRNNLEFVKSTETQCDLPLQGTLNNDNREPLPYSQNNDFTEQIRYPALTQDVDSRPASTHDVIVYSRENSTDGDLVHQIVLENQRRITQKTRNLKRSASDGNFLHLLSYSQSYATSSYHETALSRRSYVIPNAGVTSCCSVDPQVCSLDGSGWCGGGGGYFTSGRNSVPIATPSPQSCTTCFNSHSTVNPSYISCQEPLSPYDFSNQPPQYPNQPPQYPNQPPQYPSSDTFVTGYYPMPPVAPPLRSTATRESTRTPKLVLQSPPLFSGCCHYPRSSFSPSSTDYYGFESMSPPIEPPPPPVSPPPPMRHSLQCNKPDLLHMETCAPPYTQTPYNYPVIRSKSCDSAFARLDIPYVCDAESDEYSHSGTAYDSVHLSTNPSSTQESEDDEDLISYCGGLDDTMERKKRVTFQLPAEHYDSSLSVIETCGYPPSGYAELDRTLAPPVGQDHHFHGATSPSPAAIHPSQATLERYGHAQQQQQVRWRDPDLHEVIDFLSNPNNVVKANAAAYLQHLCYMDDSTKQKTKILGGIPPLVALLSHDVVDLHRNACGALRNLSYGRQNDENKKAIKEAGGIPALIRLLKKTRDNEVRELVTGILWNLSSCEELKSHILKDGVPVLVSHVIVTSSGWGGGEVERDPNNDVWWNTVFKNASGVLRNVSSAGEHARTRLRHCHGLIDSLMCVINSAINGNSHDNKCVENCVCILRNLSYRCQEVEDPNYDKNAPVLQTRAIGINKGDNLGCFGGSRNKKKEGTASGSGNDSGFGAGGMTGTLTTSSRSGHRGNAPPKGMEMLWTPDAVVQPYLSLLSECSNPETLEAAAGAIQNLAACYWQPSVEVRAAVRKEKGLPILVELLRMEVDRVVCAVATALRNLAIDQRNRQLIGKYAMRDLVQKLPSSQNGRNEKVSNSSDETIAAVLATLNEVIKKETEFSRSLMDCDGVDKLVHMTKHRGRYSARVVKFASQVLFSMWSHQELRDTYRRAGWKESDFVSKSVAARSASANGGSAGSNGGTAGIGLIGGGGHSPTANNTLSRPMASQGGTRYEDRTLHRNQARHQHHQYNRQGEEMPLANMSYGGDETLHENMRIYGQSQVIREPVYAKVNRDSKKQPLNNNELIYGHTTSGAGMDDWTGPGYATLNNGNPPSEPSNGYMMNRSEVDLVHSTAASLLNNSSTSPTNGTSTDYGTTGTEEVNSQPQQGDSWV